MKRYLRPGLLAAVGLTAILALSSCSMLRQYLPSNAESSSSSSTSGSQQNVETHTLQGTLNQIDTGLKYLVLVTEEGYFRFSFSHTGLHLSGLEPGDTVTITYTGTLDAESEDVSAQLVSISKDT